MLKLELSELVIAVKAHAEANYEKDGWDFLVECWDDAYIAEVIGKAKTAKSAIAKARKIVRMLSERRREVQSEIF